MCVLTWHVWLKGVVSHRKLTPCFLDPSVQLWKFMAYCDMTLESNCDRLCTIPISNMDSPPFWNCLWLQYFTAWSRLGWLLARSQFEHAHSYLEPTRGMLCWYCALDYTLNLPCRLTNPAVILYPYHEVNLPFWLADINTDAGVTGTVHSPCLK